MAKLNRFILNSDYDSLKIIQQISQTCNIPSFTMTENGSENARVFSFDVSAPTGVFFELGSIDCSLDTSGIKTGGTQFSFSKFYNNNLIELYYTVEIKKNSSSGYTVEVRFIKIDMDASVIGTTITIPATQIKIKLTLQVPSEQQ